ncbi:hypothetical protein Vqi01_06120 [Micromonospora qiuiae]|uniref:Uncharacterized protein n=1 Tax=Micromonospora qiuiae TaxID=502268 RepID=A0ABQ4J5L6_9ACTN|nr:hypothetical protein Vqi01_06120 [Micromonospora qiuiae]
MTSPFRESSGGAKGAQQREQAPTTRRQAEELAGDSRPETAEYGTGEGPAAARPDQDGSDHGGGERREPPGAAAVVEQATKLGCCSLTFGKG